MGGRSRGDDGAAERARQETEATKKKYEQEKMVMERTAAEQAAGRGRSRMRRSSLMAAAKLGGDETSTLGSTGV